MRALSVIVAIVLSSASAWADFDITDFSTTTVPLTFPTTLAGQPNTAAIEGDLLRVTPGVLSNRGIVWMTDAQDLATGFTTTFEFELVLGTGAGGSGDGLVFVVQNQGIDAYGDHAGALGYGGFLVSPDNGISSSLAVELDDFMNANFGDPDGNHISVHTLFDQPNSTDETTASIGIASSIPSFAQGSGSHTVRITYQSPQLDVFLDDLVTPVLTTTVDLTAVLGGNSGWIGFTGSGGSAYQVEDVLSWSFSNGGGMPGDTFRRGDANHDGGYDISDAVFTLSALFIPGASAAPCPDAQDSNDDGALDISDAVFTLSSLFVPASLPPPAPGPMTCGVDPTADALGCGVACP